MQDERDKVDGIVVIPEQSEKYLNQRQLEELTDEVVDLERLLSEVSNDLLLTNSDLEFRVSLWYRRHVTGRGRPRTVNPSLEIMFLSSYAY